MSDSPALPRTTASVLGRWTQLLPHPVDAALAFVLVWVGLPNPAEPRFDVPVAAVAVPIVVLCCVAIAYRRRFPLVATLAMGVALTAHVVVFVSLSLIALITTLVAAWTTQSRLDPPWRWTLLGAVYAGTALATVLASNPLLNAASGGRWYITLVSAFLALTVAALLGARRRSARTRVELALERVAFLEAQAQTERALAAQEERARIAARVHDLLGHSLTVITMQAEGARAVLNTRPEAADGALSTIARISRQGVEEIHGLVDLDEGGTPSVGEKAPREDSPREASAMACASDLFTWAADLQLLVSLEVDLRSAPAPAAHALLIRAIREALTNVARHAGRVPVRLSLSDADGGIALVVENDAGRAGEGGRGGGGLSGIRTSALALGGTVEAGPTASGGWRMTLDLPGGTL